MVIPMTTEFEKQNIKFRYREQGSIWENRIEYNEEGHLAIVRKDITSHLADRWDCDDIHNLNDFKMAMNDKRLPELTVYEELYLLRTLGIDEFDFIKDEVDETFHLCINKPEVYADILDAIVNMIYQLRAFMLIQKSPRNYIIHIYCNPSFKNDIKVNIADLTLVKRYHDAIQLNDVIVNKNAIISVTYNAI